MSKMTDHRIQMRNQTGHCLSILSQSCCSSRSSRPKIDFNRPRTARRSTSGWGNIAEVFLTDDPFCNAFRSSVSWARLAFNLEFSVRRILVSCTANLTRPANFSRLLPVICSARWMLSTPPRKMTTPLDPLNYSVVKLPSRINLSRMRERTEKYNTRDRQPRDQHRRQSSGLPHGRKVATGAVQRHTASLVLEPLCVGRYSPADRLTFHRQRDRQC